MMGLSFPRRREPSAVCAARRWIPAFAGTTHPLLIALAPGHGARADASIDSAEIRM